MEAGAAGAAAKERNRLAVLPASSGTCEPEPCLLDHGDTIATILDERRNLAIPPMGRHGGASLYRHLAYL